MRQKPMNSYSRSSQDAFELEYEGEHPQDPSFSHLFITSHFIAVSPPPNDDSWALENATPQVQDCAFGDALVVPPSGSGYVRYANVPMGRQFSSDSEEYAEYEGGLPELATSDEDSPTTDGGRASLCFGEDLDLYFQGGHQSQSFARHHPEDSDHASGLATAPPCRWEGPKFTLGTFSDDDDEEDGPPPITDDWFVDLAKRSVEVAAVLERAREQGS